MERSSRGCRNWREHLLSASWFLAICVGVFFSLPTAAHGQSQSQTQAASAIGPVYEYEVSTIKPYKSDGGSGPMRIGILNAPDGLTATNVTVQMLIQFAYGVQNYQISGGPAWVNSEHYEIDAKMDGAVAEALQKLSQDDRNVARQKMLQALLADRFKLTIHRDTKELPVYSLVIGKGGSKLKEAKPGDTYPNSPQLPGGRGGRGTVMFGGRGGAQTLTAQAVPVSTLVRMLSGNLGRPVLDKTGLTGVYDYTLQFAPDQTQGPSFGGPDGGLRGGDAGAPPESTAPSIFTAVQEQLGLKLESGKGPVELIVIERIEKASDN